MLASYKIITHLLISFFFQKSECTAKLSMMHSKPYQNEVRYIQCLIQPMTHFFGSSIPIWWVNILANYT